MLDLLLAIVAPHSCCGCGYHGSILCDNCKYDIISEPFPSCVKCLKPTFAANLCNRCKRHSNFEATWVVGPRKGAVRAILDEYKFSSSRNAARPLADLLDERLPILKGYVTVVPVPTSPRHRRVRGFDHTHLIARGLAKRRSYGYQQLLEKHSDSTQHFLNRSQRLEYAHVGLLVRRPVPETVLLIDDIYTTGATMDACAQLLRSNGAKTVYGAVIARQLLDEEADLW